MPRNLDSSRPIYLQIIERVQMDIITGRYQPGDKLPSVRDLAQEAAVNPNTMQKALSELERSGLIYSQRTSGRYITEEKELNHQMKKELAAAPLKKGIDWERIIGIYLTVSLVVSHILLFAMLWNIAHYAKKDAYERYKRLAGFRPYLLAGSFLFPFFVLLLYGGLGRRLKRLRNKPRNCESCGN